MTRTDSLFHHGPWVTCRLSRVVALYVVGILLGFAGGFAMATLMWGLNNVIPR